MRYLIGVGNYYGRDDSIGLRVVEAIVERGLDQGFETIDLNGNLVNAVHYLGPETDQVLFVDSAKMGRQPGDYLLFTPEEVDSRKDLAGFSTHEGDLIKVLEFAASVGGPLPPVSVLGIEPEDLGEGPGLSDALEERLEEYVAVAARFFGDT